MKASDLERAQFSLDAYGEQLGSRYLEVHAALAGSLAANEVTLENLRTVEAEKRANFSLLSDFIDFLPGTVQEFEHSDFMEFDNAAVARQAQANLLWLKAQYRGTGPHYIIGSCPATGEAYTRGSVSATHLLLFAAKGSTANPLKSVTVRDDEFSVALKKAQAQLHQPFDEFALRRMFDPDSGKLRFRNHTFAENLRTQELVYGGLPLYKYLVRDPAKLVAKRGLSAAAHQHFDNAIEDAVLGNFDVLGSLNRLALAFGRQDEYAALLDRYKDKALDQEGHEQSASDA